MSRPHPPDAGFATVWAAGAVAVLMGLLLIGIELGAAVAARHRAEAAADLAALAAAGHAVHGAAAACARAAGIAEQMDARIRTCRLDGWEALVEVEAALRLAMLGPTAATGRARAGPVPAGPPALPAPAGPTPAGPEPVDPEPVDP
ncbi:MAG: flp pilus-assembly TadE/G-like family protein, partial [Pseudonocardia sp.]|nr:flp pilus-assembly TadE/G-like family protein [Pseudonocardia sp.]